MTSKREVNTGSGGTDGRFNSPTGTPPKTWAGRNWRFHSRHNYVYASKIYKFPHIGAILCLDHLLTLGVVFKSVIRGCDDI